MAEAKQRKILAIYMKADSGGVGVDNRLALRRADRVEFEEDRFGVFAVLSPPQTLPLAQAQVRKYLIPWAALRYVEYDAA